MSSNLKRTAGPVTPVKGPKAAKKGVPGPAAGTPLMGSKSQIPRTVVPDKGTGGLEDVYTVEGDVTKLSHQETGDGDAWGTHLDLPGRDCEGLAWHGDDRAGGGEIDGAMEVVELLLWCRAVEGEGVQEHMARHWRGPWKG